MVKTQSRLRHSNVAMVTQSSTKIHSVWVRIPSIPSIPSIAPISPAMRRRSSLERIPIEIRSIIWRCTRIGIWSRLKPDGLWVRFPSSLPNLCRNQKFCGWHLIRFQIHTSFLCASSSVGRAKRKTMSCLLDF